jgi:guanosine-3',5'-bis(diphosphate) 3'-pyrophosphohydrolase
METPLLLRAADFAARKHRLQKRKDEESSPYVNHPLAVAMLLADVGDVDDTDVLAAAILHDTLEDTETTPAELETAFGRRVRALVQEVSDDKSLAKAERKRRQIDHARELSRDAVLIKLGDKIANVGDVTHSPPSNWDLARRKDYLDWAAAVVANCAKINAALEARFAEVLEEGRRKLGA